jgi:predicted DsbA family dithiol-disulfide isomerase
MDKAAPQSVTTDETRIRATLFSDPACPWGYSASPALRAIEWRYRDQIEWNLVTIGLSDPSDGPPRFSPATLAGFCVDIRDRYGMPFAIEPKSRTATSSRACQAIVATRMLQPGFEWRVLRTLQLLQFNTPMLLDDDDNLRAALSSVAGLDFEAVMAALDLAPVQDAYRRDWTEARSASGGASDLQGKTADFQGGARFTAPSVVFSRGDVRLEAGGFQKVEVYDAMVANVGPDLKRHAVPEDPLEALALYPGGLSTQELATIMTDGNDSPDRAATEKSLIAMLGEGRVRRIAMGNDAIWLTA